MVGSMDDFSNGLRKSVWTVDEDSLLKKCIDEYGEGKWHQVPLRAGLNRCMKSCKLRWLNYLAPNIKREKFSSDEIDLLLRLHKLLGNRWSLIAGRLPGRTTNDVKNYWNTNLCKKHESLCKAKMKKRNITCSPTSPATKTKILKPRPHRFSQPPSQVTEDESISSSELPKDALDQMANLISKGRRYDLGKYPIHSSSTSSTQSSNQQIHVRYEEQQ